MEKSKEEGKEEAVQLQQLQSIAQPLSLITLRPTLSQIALLIPNLSVILSDHVYLSEQLSLLLHQRNLKEPELPPLQLRILATLKMLLQLRMLATSKQRLQHLQSRIMATLKQRLQLRMLATLKQRSQLRVLATSKLRLGILKLTKLRLRILTTATMTVSPLI